MDDKDKLIQTILTGAMISFMAALVRALLNRKETWPQKVAIFIASVALGTLVGYLLRNATMSNFYKEVLVACTSGFSATVWPVIEKKFTKWVDKKEVD